MNRVLVENEIIKVISENERIDDYTKINYIKTVYNLNEDALERMHDKLFEIIEPKK